MKLLKIDRKWKYPVSMLLYRSRKLKRMAILLYWRLKNRYLTLMALPSTGGYWEEEVPLFTEAKFREDFRVHRSTFEYLIMSISRENPELDLNVLKAKLASVLYALGTDESFNAVARKFRINRVTLKENLVEICSDIWRCLGKECFTAYPPTQDRIDDMMKGFDDLGMPNCYGLLDGVHIKVFPDPFDAEEYRNYKHWYSMILLVTVDYNARFAYVNVGCKGSVSDNDLFNCTKLKETHLNNKVFRENKICVQKTNVPIYLIADLGFQLSSNVMRPFYRGSKSLTKEEQVFNDKLYTMRKLKEKAIMLLHARFKKISYGIETDTDQIKIIIKTCCLLHNLCVNKKDLVKPKWKREYRDFYSDFKQQQPHKRLLIKKERVRGVRVRHALMKEFCEELNK